MQVQGLARTVICLAAGLLAITPAVATPLYLLASSPDAGIFEVDPRTARLTRVVDLPDVGSHIEFGGIAHRPGDGNAVYVTRTVDPGRVTVQSFIERIDLTTGVTTDSFPVDHAALGSPLLLALFDLAISPTDPNKVLFEAYFPAQGPVLATLDLTTGILTGSVISDDFTAVEYSLDGAMLFGAGRTGPPGFTRFGTVDPVTGSFDSALVPGVEIAGMAFDPATGALFASNAGNTDTLVELDPVTGQLLRTIGRFGIAGPEALTFVPEPSTALLLAAGLIALHRHARRR